MINYLKKNLNDTNFKLIFNHLKENFPKLVKQWSAEKEKSALMKKSLTSAHSIQSATKTIDKELMLAEVLVGIAKKSTGKRREIMVEQIKERCPNAIKMQEEKKLSDSLFDCAFSISTQYSAIAIGLIVAAITISLLLSCGLAIVPCAISAASIGFLSGIVFFASNNNSDEDLPVLKTEYEVGASMCPV